MASEYEKAHADYRALVKKSQGDSAEAKQARADKARAMNEIRAIERDAARAGTILSATYQGDRIVTQQQTTHSKRSLQEEYVRKFDAEKVVKIGGKEQTLQDYHRNRLLRGK